MATKLQVISPDLLVHPGETIEEIISDRGISQKELAMRTGYTEKHISTVIHGQKGISAEFATRLQYALDIPASFFRNLQTNYDLEVVTFKETNNISEKELSIAKEIKNSVEELLGEPNNSKNGSDCVWFLRQSLGLSNLETIKEINNGFYRAQFDKNTSEYKMYIWQYLCEKEAQRQTANTFDKIKLKASIESIKAIMHENPDQHVEKIQSILNECGILFVVKKHITRAPIKGLTVKTKKGQVMIALTIRGKYIDIFWFTLFHEIAHVLNGDYLINQNKLDNYQEIEDNADLFASNTLIDPLQFQEFTIKNDFSEQAIISFAKKINVLPTIVIGRLMHESNFWADQSHLRMKYEWA